MYRAAEAVAPGDPDPDARKTPTLRGLWRTGPYLWDGSLGSVREAIARMLQVEMQGARLDAAGLDALEAYVLSISPFDNGRITADGAPVEPATLSARRGFEVFRRAECERCHRPPAFTRSLRFDVGTDGKWSVPTLRNVSRAAPYGHDGRWPELETAVRAMLAAREVELTPLELEQLMSYLELL